MASLEGQKAQARKDAFARRAKAHGSVTSPAGKLSSVLAGYRGAPLAGYAPMRTEIDPLPAMADASAYGPVGMPIIIQKAQPLQFRAWTPDCIMVPGPFGAQVPRDGDWITPQVLIVPLVAFDRSGGRLGYGGGFYDRTLQLLRASGPVLAIGYAYAAQEANSLPSEPTDQPLDMIVTENEVITVDWSSR